MIVRLERSDTASEFARARVFFSFLGNGSKGIPGICEFSTSISSMWKQWLPIARLLAKMVTSQRNCIKSYPNSTLTLLNLLMHCILLYLLQFHSPWPTSVWLLILSTRPKTGFMLPMVRWVMFPTLLARKVEFILGRGCGSRLSAGHWQAGVFALLQFTKDISKNWSMYWQVAHTHTHTHCKLFKVFYAYHTPTPKWLFGVR